MKNRLLYSALFVFTMLLSSCGNSDTYIISKQDSLLKVSYTDSLGHVVMPPKVKYAPYTFVIDSSDRVFFYSFPERNPDRGGVYDDPEPDLLHLMPNHIFLIPKGSEKSFFEESVLKQKSQRLLKNIKVASFKDTITSDFLKYLIARSEDEKNVKAMKDKTESINVSIRLALPEERNVITHKVIGKYYGD
ncbi:hypothetical protein [Pedobacter immunditicola]|uniref:hypothetical protein n=1 Tax=Pedobacter immunditicola TaxID=3133440 RepID=UPI0030A7D123